MFARLTKIAVFILFYLVGLYVLYTYLIRVEDSFIKSLAQGKKIQCIAYSPQHHIDLYNPRKDKEWIIKPELIKDDLEHIRKYTSCLRIYTADHGGKEALEISSRLGYQEIYLGVPIWEDIEKNKQNIDSAIELVNRYPSVKAILLGNEFFLGKKLGIHKVPKKHYEDSYKYIKQRINKPVASSELIDSFLEEFNPYTDFISAHMHVYWYQGLPENIDIYLDFYINKIKQQYPGKKIVISEVGWPKKGVVNGDATPSIENQKLLLKKAINYFEKHNIPYILFEAFDQPWKKHLHEGRVAAHWGIFNKNNRLIDEMLLWLGLYSIIAGILCILFFRVKVRGKLWTSCFACISPSVISYGYVYALLVLQDYYELGFNLSSIIFFIFTILSIIAIAYRCHMLVQISAGLPGDIESLKKYNKSFLLKADKDYSPFVSIHVPCKDEDPQMVIKCIKSLQKQNYNNYEIIILDNNTSDKSLYKPIEDYVKKQKSNVKFYHYNNLKGYKAGALNKCLKHTDPKAQIIAIVDSDYIVSQDWLKKATQYFANQEVTCVQFPQDYSTKGITALQKRLYDEYVGFFKIGMVQRAFDNAIIHHGTMICIRSSSLQEIGGWPESTIAEDVDLGLTLQNAGKRTLYVPESCGKGQMPFSHSEYCKQRFRWAIGAYQIFKKHCKSLLGFGKKLSIKQRLHYVLGYLPWFLVAMHPILLVTVLLNAVSGYFYINSLLNPALFYPYLYFMISEILFTIVSYKKRTSLSLRRIFDTALTGASLTFSISKAFWVFLFKGTVPFERTCKTKNTVKSKRIKTDELFNFVSFLVLFVGFALFIKQYQLSTEFIFWFVVSILCATPAIGSIILRYMR